MTVASDFIPTITALECIHCKLFYIWWITVLYNCDAVYSTSRILSIQVLLGENLFGQKYAKELVCKLQNQFYIRFNVTPEIESTCSRINFPFLTSIQVLCLERFFQQSFTVLWMITISYDLWLQIVKLALPQTLHNSKPGGPKLHPNPKFRWFSIGHCWKLTTAKIILQYSVKILSAII